MSYKSILWDRILDGKGGFSDHKQAISEQDYLTQNVLSSQRWLHLQSDMPDSEALLASLSLPEWVKDCILDPESRPKAIISEKGLYLCLRGINKNPGAEPDDMVSLRLWLTESMLVSARKTDRRLLSVFDAHNKLEQNDGATHVSELLCHLVERIADRISEFVNSLEDDVSVYESNVATNTGSVDRLELNKLRKQLASIKRFLAPQRDALEAIYRAKKIFSDEQIFYIREQSDRITRYVEDIDLAKERTMLLQEEMRNQVAEQHGLRMYVLSLVTAVFLPLSFLTGVFGMNVGGLPGLENSEAFVWVVLMMATIAMLIAGFMIWRRWL